MIGIVWTLVSGKIIAAFKWATQSLTHILIVALVAVAVWGWLGWHGKAKSDRVLASTVTAWKAAERESTAAQIAANSAQEARWAQQARNVDHDYQKARVDADSRSERFIRSGGLRANCPRGTGIGDTVQSPGGSGVSENMPPDTVVVAADDVRECTGAVIYATQAYQWATGLRD